MVFFPSPLPMFSGCCRVADDGRSIVSLCSTSSLSPSPWTLLAPTRLISTLLLQLSVVALTRTVYRLGSVRPFCCGMRSHSHLLFLCPCLNAVGSLFVSFCPSRGLLVVLVILKLPKLLPCLLVSPASIVPWERCTQTCKLLRRRQGVRLYERRFARTLHPRRCRGRCYPYPTYLSATVADFQPTYSIRTPMAVPSML